MGAFLAVLDKLITLFVYIFIGYIIRKKNVVDEKFQAGLVKLLMWVCIPSLTINTLQTNYSPEMLSNGVSLFAAALIIYAASFVLGVITAKIFKIKRDQKGIWIFMVMFSNNLFMGFPVIEAVLGSEALLYAAFLNIPVQIVMFTFGVQLIIKYGAKEGVKVSVIKRLISPLNIAMAIGLVLFVTGIKLPSSVRAAISGISGTITPLAMIYIGMVMSNSKIFEAFSDWKVYVVSFIRLILVPVAIYVLHYERLYGICCCCIIVRYALFGQCADICRRTRRRRRLCRKTDLCVNCALSCYHTFYRIVIYVIKGA